MFWFPEKPIRINDLSIVPDNYIAQVKKDGWRIILTNINGQFEMLNRFGEKITAGRQFDWRWIQDIIPAGKFYLDGEVIGQRQAGAISDTIVIWDALYWHNQAFHNTRYQDRIEMLYSAMLPKHIPPICIPSGSMRLGSKSDYCYRIGTDTAQCSNTSLWLSRNFKVSEAADILKKLDTTYNEGIVFKNPNSPLKWSPKSTSKSVNQLKFKIRE